MHRATLHLDMVRMTLEPAAEKIRLVGRGAMVDVDYTHMPPDPEDIGAVDVLVPKAAILVRALVLRDGDARVLVNIEAGTDILGSLAPHQVDWLAENLPIP